MIERSSPHREQGSSSLVSPVFPVVCCCCCERSHAVKWPSTLMMSSGLCEIKSFWLWHWTTTFSFLFFLKKAWGAEFERRAHEPGMGGLTKLSCIMGKEVPSVWAARPILLTVTQDIWGAAASILTMFFKHLSLLSTWILWKWNTKLLEHLFKILKSCYLVDVYVLMNESHNKFQITGQFF